MKTEELRTIEEELEIAYENGIIDGKQGTKQMSKGIVIQQCLRRIIALSYLDKQRGSKEMGDKINEIIEVLNEK